MDGVAKASDESWMEVSFLAPGMTRATGLKLAAKYGQLAIIYGEINRKAELHFL
jgi:hypothetical protein